MNRIFIGYDDRQIVAYTALQQSIIEHSTKPVQITPLVIETLPIERRGLTPFTFSRFLVPWLCDYKGWALFLDADMLVLDDISKLFALADPKYAVMVAKNEKRFEWASAMLFNSERCRQLTPEFVEMDKAPHNMRWLAEEEIGGLPPEWNHLVGYDAPKAASLIHYTQGIPYHQEVQGREYDDEWHQTAARAMSTVPWFPLMGTSVHAQEVHRHMTARINGQIKE